MEELLNSIVDYIKRPVTDYAIMINGEWGCGKTYFWNNRVKKQIESMEVDGKQYKTIYMSLYGVNSLEEISKKVYMEASLFSSRAIKSLSSTAPANSGGLFGRRITDRIEEKKSVPEYTKMGIDMANLFGDLKIVDDKNNIGNFFETNNLVLCFDDLERANIDVIDILGYINNFVEHDSIKAIVICNEKELANKFKNTNAEFKTYIAAYLLNKEGKLNSNEENSELKEKPLAKLIEDKMESVFDRANAYERIKEKLIGETFEFIPAYPYILNGMIVRYNFDVNLERFLKKNANTIIEVFTKTGTRNLRILKHALSDFEKIFDAMKKYYPDTSDELMKSILAFTIAISFEIKAGNISKEKLKNVDSNSTYRAIIYNEKGNVDNDQFYLREFDNKYFTNIKNEYHFFKFIEEYVRTRNFDMKIFKSNIDEAIRQNTGKKVYTYVDVINGECWKLDDINLKGILEATIMDIREGITPFKDFIKVYVALKYMYDLKVIVLEGETLETVFKNGMIQAVKKQKYEPSDIEALDEIEDGDADLGRIKKLYAESHSKMLERYNYKIINEVFKNIFNNIQDMYKLTNEEFTNLPIFKNYDMEILYERLISTDNYFLYNFLNIMRDRYTNKKELLEEDSEKLKQLTELLKKYVKDNKGTVKVNLIKDLKKILETLLK